MSYLSLVLTAATGAGLLTLYNYLMAEKLHGGCRTATTALFALPQPSLCLTNQTIPSNALYPATVQEAYSRKLLRGRLWLVARSCC